MELVFASNNAHKIAEVQRIVGDSFKLLSLNDIACHDDIPENQPTIEGNASEKSWYVYNKFNINCFADDTGLEIDALNGEPGVHSARYSGELRDYQQNVLKVLKNMEGVKNRTARFKTIISLILNGIEYQFDGIVNGVITEDIRQKHGFGYDPIFIPDGYELTYSQMDPELKDAISHRGLSVNKLAEFLKEI